MSGVHRIITQENGSNQKQVTNEDLREEGVGSASVDAQKDSKEGEK